MRVVFDSKDNVAYIYLKDEIGKGEAARTVEAEPGIMLDFSSTGVLLGIEVLNANKKLHPDLLVGENVKIG